jgi:PhnB protein
MSEQITAATGHHTTDGTPYGSTSLTPHLVVSPAAEALDFYVSVFDAVASDVLRTGDLVTHAELDFGHGLLTLSDPMEGFAASGPEDEVTFSLALYLPDVDAAFERAVDAGAVVLASPSTFVSGDRFATVLDPFGVRWAIMTRVEDLSPDETRRRVAEWSTQQVS